MTDTDAAALTITQKHAAFLQAIANGKAGRIENADPLSLAWAQQHECVSLGKEIHLWLQANPDVYGTNGRLPLTLPSQHLPPLF